jgi:hypothetical protein
VTTLQITNTACRSSVRRHEERWKTKWLELVGLWAKVYAFRVGSKGKKKAKGIKKCEVDRELNFDNYRECLFGKEELYKRMNIMRG